MLNKLTKLKNYICKIFVVLCIITFSLIAKTSINTTKQLFALNVDDVSEDFLGNPNFYTSSSSNISSNSHWSTIVPSDEKHSDEFKKGIVKLDKIESTLKSDTEETANKTDGTMVDKLWKNFGLFTSPGAVDNISIEDEDKDGVTDYLMINAYNFAGHLGYESDDFTLQKGSFYKIGVTLKTINDSKTIEYKEDADGELITEERVSHASASIYLNGISDTEENNTRFELINTNNEWKTYYFYINTNSFSAEEDVTLQLYLGSKTHISQGAVFFSHIKIEQYSEAEYEKEFTSEIAQKTNVKNISLDNAYEYDLISNPNFESNFENWTTIGSNNNGDIFSEIIDTSKTGYLKGSSSYPAIPANNNSSVDNIKALAIYSNPNEETSTYYGVESDSFVVEQYAMYRISMYAYSNSGSANGAYITLFDVDNEASTKSQKISTSMTSNELSNNWTKYEFYVKGNSLRDTSMKLRFTIGTNDSKDNTLNYAFFDDIRVQKINYADYSTGKSDSNSLELNASLSSDMMISNYTFDMVENSEIEAIKPLTATGWKITGTEDMVYGGVVNTNSTLFANNISNYASITNLVNPGKINTSNPIDSNNVLMLGTTKTNKTISCKTANTFNLSESSYYKLTFDVFTQNLSNTNKGANLVITDDNGSELLAVKDIQTNKNWKSYTYYIATNLFANTCELNLSIENTDMYAYFDNICLQSITKEVFAEVKDNIVDLNKTYLDDTKSWSVSGNNDTAYFGTMNAEDNEISVDGQKIAYIISDDDVNYTATSAETFTLEASSYYKISTYINTKNLRKLTNTDNITEFGGKFALLYNNTTDGFTNISTNSDSFDEYAIYVSTDSSSTTINILLGLGDKDNKVTGEIYFTNLQITKFADETSMTEDKESTTAKISTINIKSEETPENDSTTEDTEPYNVEPNWMLISSLITSGAMILAILAYFIRKIDFKKKKKKVDTSYDRRQTLDKRYDLEERINYREELITALNEELESIKETTNKYKEEHDNNLDRLRLTADTSSEDLKIKLDELYKEKLEISKEHNRKIAKDKLNASKEEDDRYNAKMAELEKSEKQIKAKIKSIDKIYDKEKSKYDALITRSKTKQDEINHEISTLRNEIQDLKDEIKQLAEGKK